jgi:anti-sigma factor RsiW
MLCGRVTNLLSAFIDSELAGAEMLQVREHLAACAACRQEQASLLEMKSLLGQMPAATPRRDLVGATVGRWQAEQAEWIGPPPGPMPGAARRFRIGAGWRFFPALPIVQLGQGARVSALAAALVISLVATGAALRQPVTADAVVARLPRAGVEDWQVRPWEAVVGRRSAWRQLWNGGLRPAASEEQWLLLSLAPATTGGEEDSAVGLVREIAHRQPIGLSWALE